MAKVLSLQDSLLEKPTPKRVGSFKEVKGNLIEMAKSDKFDFIGHGCNCFATMGAGIAKSIAENFSAMKKADKDYSKYMESYEKLGNFSMAQVKTKKNIFMGINFYSQYYPGPDFDKEALKLSLKKFCILHKDQNIDLWSFGLPLIGCGIAGGEWDEVREIIKSELSEFDVTIVHFNQ